MEDLLRHSNSHFERDIEKVITALKKGARLLKYGRRGKPKFCPFRLSIDESALIWYVGKAEKQLLLSQISKIIPGQRTAIFQRYPQPDKEYQSFSLIYKDRSLDLVCKDKDEAEVWFVGLKSLIPGGNYWKRSEIDEDQSSDANARSLHALLRRDISDEDSGSIQDLQILTDNPTVNGFGKVVCDAILTASKSFLRTESQSNPSSSFSSGNMDYLNGHSSSAENVRVSTCSAISSSSYGSGLEDFDALSDVFIWGDVSSDGIPGDSLQRTGYPVEDRIDAPFPKQLQAAFFLDVQHVACSSRYAALVTKQGEVYSWGEELGGRLGHGVDAYVSHPKLIDALANTNIQFVSCGEHHACAVTLSGDLYTWGDGIHNSGLLGHGTEASHWIPKLVVGPLEGLPVSSVSCGPWHTAIVISTGQLFTFGEGSFGALGHGDHNNVNIPKEVETLRGWCVVRAACGVWHTAAIVELSAETADSSDAPCGKLFTWGDGDKGRLGHGDRKSLLLPACVTTLTEPSFCQVSCGQDITVALSVSGRVYTMGSSAHGQLGNPEADTNLPTCVERKLHDSFVKEIACGSYHTVVLTSRAEVYSWGKGASGQLGHGDHHDRNEPTLVETLKGKQVKKIVCGPNFTASICIHKWVSGDDLSVCSGCQLPFGFRRKRHNCYNCGLVFCISCSCRKSFKAALAPSIQKPYRVCEDCYTKIKRTKASGMHSQIPKHPNGGQNQMSSESQDKEILRSRLSTVGSFKGESKRWQMCKSELNNSQLSPTLNEWSDWGRTPIVQCQSSNRLISASVPGSRIASRSTSPVSSMPSPLYSPTAPTSSCLVSPEVAADHSTKTTDVMSVEAVSLHSQLEELTHKSLLLEAELAKMNEQFREAKAIAGEQTSKCEAAEDVIKSLTLQLKDMAERVAEGYVIDANGILTEELVEQDAPGVLVTASSSPGGNICLKRVYFRRKQFNKQQAQKWWADNIPRLQQKYNSPANSLSVTAKVNEMVD